MQKTHPATDDTARANYEGRLEKLARGRGAGRVIQQGLTKQTMGMFHKLVREITQQRLEDVAQASGTTRQNVNQSEKGLHHLSYERLKILETLTKRDLLPHLPRGNNETREAMVERLLAEMATLEEVVAYRFNNHAEGTEDVRNLVKGALHQHGIMLTDAGDIMARSVEGFCASSGMKMKVGETEAILACIDDYVVRVQSDDDRFLAASRRHLGWVRQRVRFARQMKGMTFDDMGKVIGLDKSHVAHFENGSKAPVYWHRRHALALVEHWGLGATPEELFLPEEDMQGTPLRSPREGLAAALRLTDEEKRAYVANRHMPRVRAWATTALAASGRGKDDVLASVGDEAARLRLRGVLQGNPPTAKLRPGELEKMAAFFAFHTSGDMPGK